MTSTPPDPDLASAGPTTAGRVTQLAVGYWAESRGPLASLVFITPLLLTYAAGVLLLGPEKVQNGADAWLRALLAMAGFAQYFLLPILTVCILLGWHYITRQPWRLSRGLLWGMAGECLLLAVCLWMLLQLQAILFQFPAAAEVSSCGIFDSALEVGKSVASYLGAGIYEELLFRLILLMPMVWGLIRLGINPRLSMVIAITLNSLLFASAHYVGPYGDALDPFSFTFRFLAGAFFSILFVCRGFGIAAGSHAGYDILVGLFAS